MDATNVTTIICPDCGAELAPTSKTCEHCAGTAKQPLLSRPWIIVVLMLHVGLLGIPLYWKTTYSLGVRLLLVAASIIYTVGAVAIIVGMLRWMVHQVVGG